MANVIKLKTGTSTPTTSNLVDKEVAIDTSAKKLYINDDGTVKEIGDSKVDKGANTDNDITARMYSGFYQTATAATDEGWPETTNSWYHLLANTHHNTENYYSQQLASPFFTTNNGAYALYHRNTANTGTRDWQKLFGSRCDAIPATDNTYDLGSGSLKWKDLYLSGALEAKAIRYGSSHVKRISVDYTGEATHHGQVDENGNPVTDGSNYLNDDELQEILTITPNGNSENYSIIGRIMAASGANVHTLDVNIALRSNTLPDLHVSGSYISTITGSTAYLTPRLWLKETTTAAFKLVVEINAQIFGRVTADLEIISRHESDLDNIVVNEDETSEVTAIPTGYAQTTPTKVYETDDGAFAFTNDLTATGDITATTFVKSGGTSSQYLMADGSVSTGGGSSTLSGLTDVTLGTLSNGQVLKYNGSAWINDTDETGSGGGGGGSTDLLEIMLFT